MARKLKKYVVPSVLSSIGVGLLIGVPLYVNETKPVNSNYKYTMVEKEKTEKIFPVLNEVEENKPLKPYLEETVGKTKDYYSSKDDDTNKINSLVYYDNTYMPNTGILYSAEESFDVIAVQDGTISKVGEDNILGKYIEVEHKGGYKTTYYSLSKTNVTKGSNIQRGDVIGVSGPNKLEGSMTNNILFETYYNGTLQDPEDFYNVDFNKLD